MTELFSQRYIEATTLKVNTRVYILNKHIYIYIFV